MQPQIEIGTTFTEYYTSGYEIMIKLWEVERLISEGIYSCLPQDKEYRCQFTAEEITRLLNTKQENL
jgi:hypothetical protein